MKMAVGKRAVELFQSAFNFTSRDITMNGNMSIEKS